MDVWFVNDHDYQYNLILQLPSPREEEEEEKDDMEDTPHYTLPHLPLLIWVYEHPIKTLSIIYL